MTCSARVGALIATLLISALACTTESAEDPRLREPAFFSSTERLAPLLEQTARLAGTPMARLSREIRQTLAGCDLVGARFRPDDAAPGGFLPEWSCLDQPAGDADTKFKEFALAERGEHDAILFWPVGEDGRTSVRFDLSADGSVSALGELIVPSHPGLLGLLIPGDAPPAAAVLNPPNTLIRAHARPRNGLGLADLVPSGGQADRMFALKGRLLEGALLAGTWEINVLPPAPGGRLPLPILALHHRGIAPTTAALDQALSQLEATWPIKRTKRKFSFLSRSSSPDSIEGGCFLELPLLPELAPCWAVHPEALIVGWRAEAIETALGVPAVSASPNVQPTAPAQLEVRLDQFAQVDRALQGVAAPLGIGDLFSNLSLSVEPESEGRVLFQISLASRK